MTMNSIAIKILIFTASFIKRAVLKSFTNILKIILLLFLFLPSAAKGQLLNNSVISKEGLIRSIEALTRAATEGRSTGSSGIALARDYIYDGFIEAGLQTMERSYGIGFYHFKDNEKLLGVNVVGVVEADSSLSCNESIVIAAHYDHIGIIEGKLYSGADNNASGVAALIEIAKQISHLKKEGGLKLKRNMIFAALDAKENDLSGSRHFIESYNNERFGKIILMVNLNQIGTTLAPPQQAKTMELLPKNYLLILGREEVDSSHSKALATLEECNRRGGYNMVLDYTFYGSKEFYNYFNNIGDQTIFRERGIPALLITSGFNKYTLKPEDRADKINYNALLQRCSLLALWLGNIANQNYGL